MTTPHPLGATRRSLGRRFGITEESRTMALESMLRRPEDDAWSYWFQLLTSMGMATLGLVLGSPAVVIGAMLVAPLMTPIIETAMALLVGSSLLLLRSALRVVASVVAVVACAAAITRALPYQEPTAEILARTGPTLLDLGVAVCCALAAAFTTARPFSGAASTAAGTAIGISLVPPLCATGFGVGIGDRAIAEGALLLFTANLSAIMAFAGLFFWLVGYDAMPPEATDDRALGRGAIGGLMLPLARRVDAGLSSRWHLLFRIGPPLALLAAIIVPLDQALQRVAWQVQTTRAVQNLVQADPLLRDAVSTATTVEQGRVEFRAVIVGREDDAARLERNLTTSLAAASGLIPTVAVRAVTAGEAIARRPDAAAGTAAMTSGPSLSAVAARLDSAVNARWPESAAGHIVARSVGLDGKGHFTLRIAHWGAPPGAVAEGLLEAALASDFGVPVDVTTLSLRREPHAAPVWDAAAWWPEAVALIERSRDVAGVSYCVGVPNATLLRRTPAARPVHEALLRVVGAIDPARVRVTPGREWSLQLREGPCLE
jgi:uncharacterized hydrophobic protein (TIGR00271 family)